MATTTASSRTQLKVLRSQLSGLRRARANARLLSALLAVGTAILWTLAVLFVLDWLFQREMQAPQRAVLILLGIGVVAWAFRHYAMPLLSVRETDIDMALMVERQQQIESDLVAALQFEDDVEGRWGSRQLENAVIDYVAHLGPDIDVYQGFNREQLVRRGTIFGATAAVVVLFALIFPGHVAVFGNRLALGSAHYPSATQIEAVAVNGRNVLVGGMQPVNIRCAEGRQVEFLVRTTGRLPEVGLARLASKARSQRTQLELKPLTEDQRLARLQKALGMVGDARKSPGLDMGGPWFDELASLVQFELPEEWAKLGVDDPSLSGAELMARVQDQLPALDLMLTRATDAWPSAEAQSVALYQAQLPRLNEAVSYRLSLGDAYTDPADISMIALPAVEARLTPVPPAYAAKALAREQVGRQAAVLTGSEVRLAIECTNKKPLREAWALIRTAGSMQAKRFDLQPTGEGRTSWTLPENTPLASVEEELRYEIQVTDEDGLHLETPIKGSIRIRADKPPIAIASTVHRVVLPTAKPSIQYRAGDDFGLKQLQLVVEVERQGREPASLPSASSETSDVSGEAPSPSDSTSAGAVLGSSTTSTSQSGEPAVRQDVETTTINLLASGGVVPLDRLPIAGKATINLATLKLNPQFGPLEKGDRLKVVLVAQDDRGDAPGETFRSEPLVIEVSDEFGVASAVGEADPQAEQRVSEIIKRQLGIGESP
jgi:hypothetical protein